MTFNIENYRKIQKTIEKKGKNTQIIAISKYHPKNSIIEAINEGVRYFGENRVQEALEKFSDLKNDYKGIRLHFTGNLQTNKIKQALSIFDVFQTVYKESQLKEFAKHEKQTQNKTFFVQINTGKEESKGGVSPELAEDFVNTAKTKYKLNVIGLMCIPPFNENPKEHFLLLQKLKNKTCLEKLSMGMSGDYEEAIDSGSDFVRIGTLLFGERKWAT